jgi:hypothetical protein
MKTKIVNSKDLKDSLLPKDYFKEEAIKEENKKEKMISILEEHGIEMSIGGCGCCGSPWITFIYKGEVILDNVDDMAFNMIKKE